MDIKELRELVCSKASLADLLEENGHSLRTPTSEEQISCPFHGTDASPSARHYPETNSMHCFTCKKSWDPISFVMEYRGTSFKEAVDFLAKKYDIDITGFRAKSFKRKKIAIVERKRTQLSLSDKMKMAWEALEDRVLSCRGSAPMEKYALMVYLLSHLKEERDWDKFHGPAKKILEQVKKYSMVME